VLARQNSSGRCAVQRGADNALRLQSVGEHAGIGSAIILRIIVLHAALVAPGRAHGHQRRNRASPLRACRGAGRSKASQRAVSCQSTRSMNSWLSVFQSEPLRHTLGLTGRPSRRANARGSTLVLARHWQSGLCAVSRGMCAWLRLESVGEFIGISGATVLRTISFVAARVVSKQGAAACRNWPDQTSAHLPRIGLPKFTASA
jgi:hypothetical protein